MADTVPSDSKTSLRPKTRRHFITIDLLALVLRQTFFAPHIAWLIPLCLRAIGTRYHAKEFIAAVAWASTLTAIRLFGVVSNRLAYGLPRQVDWAYEVVLITGGASGLGRVMAQMYAMRGASVAVLDVRIPTSGNDQKEGQEAVEGVRYYECDVSNVDAVAKCRDRIEADIGPPSILINNAAIVTGKAFLSLKPSDLTRSFSINLLGPLQTTRTFLSKMLSDINSDNIPGATIVTISSVLGKLGAAKLSDYTAAKAGLIAFHRSLIAELTAQDAPEGAEHVRCVLVTPGQMDTGMFAGVQTPSSFLGPVVEPVALAREIVRIVDSGMSGEVSLPLYAMWIEWIGVLPMGIQRVVRGLAGVDRAMDGFFGNSIEGVTMETAGR